MLNSGLQKRSLPAYEVMQQTSHLSPKRERARGRQEGGRRVRQKERGRQARRRNGRKGEQGMWRWQTPGK